jgi:2'-5' RNA ligase
MQAVIALDVAILPPPDASRRAIDASAQLPRSESQGLLLGPDYLPHVTLLQVFVLADRMPALFDRLDAVLAHRAAMTLRVSGGGSGGSSVWMAIDRTAALVDLHERVLDAAQPFEEPHGDARAFYGDDARERDVNWVTTYRKAASHASFRPHITLGHASRPPRIEPFEFTAATVAACHLGRFCSCRRSLRTWMLG